MSMQITGTLKTWNQDKGFGFITPVNGGQDIFVHISEYPRAGGPPLVGEPLMFEVTLNKEGKKKAVKVARPGQPANPRRPVASRERYGSPSFIGRLITGLLILALAGAGYKYLLPRFNPVQPSTDVLAGQPSTAASSTPSGLTFQCDGRRYCSQMTSCEEAKYFLRNCPGTEMDGDGDGVPCESQWCTSLFSK